MFTAPLIHACRSRSGKASRSEFSNSRAGLLPMTGCCADEVEARAIPATPVNNNTVDKIPKIVPYQE